MLLLFKKITGYLKGRDSDRLIRHSALLMAGAQVVNLCNLAFQLIAMRVLDNAGYGVLGVMLSVFGFSCISLAALSRGVTHYAALLKAQGKVEATLPLARMIAFDVVLGGLFLFALCWFFRSGICGFFQLDSFGPFALMSGSVLFLALHGLFSGVLQGLQRFGDSIISSIFQGASRLIILLIVIVGGLSATDALSAHMISYVLGLCVCFWFVYRAFSGLTGDSHGMDRINRRTFYGYSLMYLLTWIGFSAMMSLDLVVAKHYFDAETAGIFAKIVVLARMVVFLPLPVASALFPKVVTSAGSATHTRSTLVKGLLMVGGIVFVVAVGASAFSPLVLRIMRVPEGNALLFIAMLWALVPLSFVYLLLNYELAQRRFAVVFPVGAAALIYLVLLMFYHDTMWHIAMCLAVSTVLMLTMLLLVCNRCGQKGFAHAAGS